MLSADLQPSYDGRAWIEVNLDAIAHNAAQIRAVLADGCELMAVVKADAYGHGAVKVAQRLQREGVGAFAVASLSEAIELREGGIDSEILVLGYTHPADAALLYDFGLTQMAVDGAYAKALDAAWAACKDAQTGAPEKNGAQIGNGAQSNNETQDNNKEPNAYNAPREHNTAGGKSELAALGELKVHIAIDTGMHRLGVDYADIAQIEGIFSCQNLSVEGIASHFASSDSVEADDIAFTNTQIERFFKVCDCMKRKGYNIGKQHIQASYGILNYLDTPCDYVRAGIALYGVLSSNGAVKTMLDLWPALSMKARVAEVRQIGAGESVSYGRTFTAEKPLMLATVCIGYADGIPRQMSGSNGVCLIRGQIVPILGRICMDLLMIDVTGIESVAPGDVVTLIGSDGNNTIRCEDVAESSGTITNDILCRLGGRLPRVYVESGERREES